MGQLRNQLSSLTVADLAGGQIATAGGKVFVSSNAIASQEEVLAISRVWSAVHVPAYGSCIPGTAKTLSSTDSSPTVYAPGANECAYINGLSVSNTNSTDAAVVSITVGSATVFKESCPPGESLVVVGAGKMAPFEITSPATVGITAAGATPGDVAVVLSYALTVQG